MVGLVLLCIACTVAGLIVLLLIMDFLTLAFSTDYRSATIDNEAKNKKAAAKKRYEKLLKDKSPKLYDKPPHLR